MELFGACFVLYSCPILDKREGASYISWGWVPKCDDLMKMTPENVKMTARSAIMLLKCNDFMKMMPEKAKLPPRSTKISPKCGNLMRMMPDNIKMTPRIAKMMPKCDPADSEYGDVRLI